MPITAHRPSTHAGVDEPPEQGSPAGPSCPRCGAPPLFAGAPRRRLPLSSPSRTLLATPPPGRSSRDRRRSRRPDPRRALRARRSSVRPGRPVRVRSPCVPSVLRPRGHARREGCARRSSEARFRTVNAAGLRDVNRRFSEVVEDQALGFGPAGFSRDPRWRPRSALGHLGHLLEASAA